jgi:AcrR family transcriptional regulator
MTRPKTISDGELLAVARKLFRAQGHMVSTRQVAEAAGISEAILYQRFGNKDELFFAAMAPGAPDLEEILGPEEPEQDASTYLKGVAERMASYFGEVLPLAVRLLAHPSFDQKSLGRAQTAPEKLREGLVLRLKGFEARKGAPKGLRRGASEPLARLIVSLTHDSAIGLVMSGRSPRRTVGRDAELAAMVELVLTGAEVRTGAR